MIYPIRGGFSNRPPTVMPP